MGVNGLQREENGEYEYQSLDKEGKKKIPKPNFLVVKTPVTI